jgi:hypothetical protein
MRFRWLPLTCSVLILFTCVLIYVRLHCSRFTNLRSPNLQTNSNVQDETKLASTEANPLKDKLQFTSTLLAQPLDLISSDPKNINIDLCIELKVPAEFSVLVAKDTSLPDRIFFAYSIQVFTTTGESMAVLQKGVTGAELFIDGPLGHISKQYTFSY